MEATGAVSPYEPESTVTVNDVPEPFNEESTALACTVVEPSGKSDPLGGSQVTGTTPSKASVALRTKLTTLPRTVVAVVTMFENGAITGGVVSPVAREKLTRVRPSAFGANRT